MSNEDAQLFTRRGAARQVGCSPDTIRAYQRNGLIKPKHLDAGKGDPVFSAADVAKARRTYRANLAKPRYRHCARSER